MTRPFELIDNFNYFSEEESKSDASSSKVSSWKGKGPDEASNKSVLSYSSAIKLKNKKNQLDYEIENVIEDDLDANSINEIIKDLPNDSKKQENNHQHNKQSTNEGDSEDEYLYSIFIFNFLLFLNSYICGILYLIDIYPKELYYIEESFNLNYTKFIKEKNVCLYLKEFLESIKKVFESKGYIKSISLVVFIIQDDSGKLVESDHFVFEVKHFFRDFAAFSRHDVELIFKTLLYQLYTNPNISRKVDPDIDRTFRLMIETEDVQIEHNFRVFEEIQEEFIKNWISGAHYYKDKCTKIEKIGVCELSNFNLEISRMEYT